jgi:hypothetical protein
MMDARGTGHASSPAEPLPTAGFFATIARSMRDAVRVLFFRRVDPRPMAFHGSAVVAMTLLVILSEITFGWIANRRISMPSTWGLTSTTASLGLLAAGLLLLSGRRKAFDVAGTFCTLLAIGILLSPAMMLLAELAERLPESEGGNNTPFYLMTAATIAAGVWWIASLAIFGARLMPSRRFLGALGILAVALLSDVILPSRPLVASKFDDGSSTSLVEYARDLIRPPPEPAEKRPPIDVESAYARQPHLVAAELAQLQPSRKDVSEIYFVAAGTYAGQEVFLREASSAREIFDARLGTAGRSLLLVNNPQTVDTLPLANATNIEQVLNGLSKVMDIDKDVLVLFLTSHGTQEALAVSFDGFSFNDLTPDRLAGILARSPIRHRVVIISACHAGTFIPALEGNNTMVLTAARTDRTSFGCSNEREWTYFGDAFFNRGLRQTRSLVDAFDIARRHIDVWEKRDKLTPSEPQISIGQEIGAKLREIIARLDAEPPASSSPTTR